LCVKFNTSLTVARKKAQFDYGGAGHIRLTDGHGKGRSARRKGCRAGGICTGGRVFTGKDLHERQDLFERDYDGRRSNLGG
jgi:hypothetical protein